ncbi:SDR family oxidoreductase [Alteromonas sp. H39]|uniref:SDR family oxidoreductase n=1 Tax=Alteromonas sp. H39 TaxID=3389876 RepID=UPI0039E0D7D8
MSLNILITGSEGYLGRRLVSQLGSEHNVVGIDIRAKPEQPYAYHTMDIRDPALADLLKENDITHVIHLASVMKASDDRERDYDIDVNGTANVLSCCLKAGVEHITVSSSGAAYGYHADNPYWLTEEHSLRGNDHFAYSQHKRLIEEMLAAYRCSSPQLRQLILRPGTVLGSHTQNQITHLFEQRRLLAVKGSPSPFVFIWDEDVVAIIAKGVTSSKTGMYNLAGDGAMTIDEIARALNKPLLRLPAWLLYTALVIGHKLRLTQYSAEQLDFLRYRPVLSNQALKQEFGYTPRKTSREVFEYFVQHNQARLG